MGKAIYFRGQTGYGKISLLSSQFFCEPKTKKVKSLKKVKVKKRQV